MEFENLEQILARRKEIEGELIDFLKEAESGFTLKYIQEVIYEEEDVEDLTDLIAMFDTGQGMLEMSTVLETINDAWNYFPHKVLGGISPAEILLRYQKKQKRD